MSRRYLTANISITLALVIAALVIMWAAPATFIVAFAWLPVYFAVLAGLQHMLIVKAMSRSPKTFVQVFLGSTVGVLFVHLVVLAAYLMTDPSQGRRFLIAFCIGYVVYLVFETAALVSFVKNVKKRGEQ